MVLPVRARRLISFRAFGIARSGALALMDRYGVTTMPRFMSVGRAPKDFVREDLDRIVETFTDF